MLMTWYAVSWPLLMLENGPMQVSFITLSAAGLHKEQNLQAQSQLWWKSTFAESQRPMLSTQSCGVPQRPLSLRQLTRHKQEPEASRAALFPKHMGIPGGSSRCCWSAAATATCMQVLFLFVCCKQWIIEVQVLETTPTEALQKRMQVHLWHPLLVYMDIDCWPSLVCSVCSLICEKSVVTIVFCKTEHEVTKPNIVSYFKQYIHV